MAGGTPSTELSELLLVALIVASLTLEFLLHRLERWVAHRHRHLQSVIRNLYRELLILGVVSFVFIIIELTAHPGSETVASFEFAHVFIFLLAIVHTAVVLCTVGASLNLSRRWRRMEQMDLVQYLELKEQFRRAQMRRRLHHGPLWRRVQWWLPDPRTLVRYWRLHEIMAFHDIRFQFLYYRDLPEDFNFSAYLRKIKAVIFIDLVDAHWSLWMIFLVVVVADITRRRFWVDPRFEGAFAVAASVFLTLSVALVTWKIRRIYWALTKHPATYFDHVSKEEVLDHLAAPARTSLSLSARPSSAAAPVHASDADDEATDAVESSTPATSGTPPTSDSPERLVSGSLPAQIDDVGENISPTMGASGTGAVVAATFRRSLDGRPPISAAQVSPIATPLGTRRSIDAAVNPYLARPSASSRASFERPRITNLVYSDPLDAGGVSAASGAGSAGEAGKKRGAGKKKPRRILEPLDATAGDIAEIAALHSLAVRPDVPRALSPLSARASRHVSQEGDSSPPSGSPRTGSSSPTVQSRQTTAADSIPVSSEMNEGMEYYGGGSSGVVRVSMDGLQRGHTGVIRVSTDEHVEGGDPRSGRDSAGVERRSIDRTRPSLDRGRRSMDEAYRHSFERRRSLDGAPGGRRRSVERADGMIMEDKIGLVGSVALPAGPRTVELAAAFPVDELAGRDGDDEDVSNGHVALNLGSAVADGVDDAELLVDDRAARQDLIRSSIEASRVSKGSHVSDGATGAPPRFVNKSLVKHAADMTTARQQSPGGKYPKIVTSFAPRLRRVASKVEKLFWFGSHRFFLWCVEFQLFFATVLFSSTGASTALVLLRVADDENDLSNVAVAGLVCSFLTLVYVLVRISYVMKKYTFVLNNAGLVPEVLALQTIHNVRQKRQLMIEMFADTHDDASGTDSEADMVEAARERRRKFSRFFATDAQQSGHIPGAVDLGAVPNESLFQAKGSHLLPRRRRKRAPPQDIPLVPNPPANS